MECVNILNIKWFDLVIILCIKITAVIQIVLNNEKGKKTQTFRSIAQVGALMKFDHTKLFDKDDKPENLKGFKIFFAKEFKRKGKSVSEIIL